MIVVCPSGRRRQNDRHPDGEHLGAGGLPDTSLADRAGRRTAEQVELVELAQLDPVTGEGHQQMTAARRWAPWVLLVALGVAALVAGLHKTSATPSLDARVLHIAGEVRCPVCPGESAAQSQVALAVQIRDQIRQELVAGESEDQILAGFVTSYGPGILEKPRASGVALLVWVVPVVAILAGAGGLVVAFGRWRAQLASVVRVASDADRTLVEDALSADLTAGAGTADGPREAGQEETANRGVRGEARK